MDYNLLQDRVRTLQSSPWFLLVQENRSRYLLLQHSQDNAKQCLHADYDLDDSRSNNSLFLIAALQDETSLRIVIDDRESIVYFNKGDLFVGLGHLIHGGNSYNRDNVRAHWYAESPGSSREEDVTYHVEEREIKPPYTKLTLEHIANIERKRGIKRRRVDNINNNKNNKSIC